MSLTSDELKLLNSAICSGAFLEKPENARPPQAIIVDPAMLARVKAMADEDVRIILRWYQVNAAKLVNDKIEGINRNLTDLKAGLAEITSVVIQPTPPIETPIAES